MEKMIWNFGGMRHGTEHGKFGVRKKKALDEMKDYWLIMVCWEKEEFEVRI